MINIEQKKYKDKQIICLQNSPTDKLYVLKKGKIRVVVNNEKNITQDLVAKTGHEVNVITEPNQTVGEIGMLLKRERSASLIASGEVELEEISFSEEVNFSEIIKHNKEIGYSVLSTVILRTANITEQIYTTKKEIDELLAEYNDNFAILQNFKTTDKKIIDTLTKLKKTIKSAADPIIENFRMYNSKISQFQKVEPLETNVFEKNVIFFDEKSAGDYIYLQLSGKITVLCNNIPIFTSDKQNTIFCDYSIFLKNIERPKNYFAFLVNEKSKVRRIAKFTFDEMLENQPILYSHLSKIISALLINSDKVITDLKKKRTILENALAKDKENSILKAFTIIKAANPSQEISDKITIFLEKYK
ncbi:MAG TPA: cyclic nucleotide-binding domain-containing protein [bacterium]|nr:cyclic nucleotide-binding domain-containing protein [bacterium]